MTVLVEELADNDRRIEIQELDVKSNLHPVEGEACVELLSQIKNLKVENKYCKISKSVSSNGADVFNITIDIKQLQQIRHQLDSISEVLGKINDKGLNVTEEEAELLSRLPMQIEKMENQYEEMKNIVVYGTNIKMLEIPIDGLGAKQKINYSIVELTKAIELSYEQLLATAEEYFMNYANQSQSSYFEAGASAYKAVLDHKDCPTELRDSFNIKRNKLLDIRKFTYFIEKADDKWKMLSEQKGFADEEVYKYLNGARLQCKKMLAKYPEMILYQPILETLEQKTSEHPQSTYVKMEKEIKMHPVIEGTVTKGRGWFMPVEGLRIYGAYKKDFNMRDIKDWMLPLDRVKNGKYTVVLKQPYTYLYFEGEKSARPINGTISEMNVILTR